MRKSILFLILFLSFGAGAAAREVRNVVVMISDGTSVPVLSLARWYQWGVMNGQARLAVDPYLSGLVKTHGSDAVIGDSAPTSSTYFTGYLSRSGFVSTYPTQTDNDIYPLDPERALQPLATVGEAMRILQGKSVGLVVTCEFPHATPADAMSHSNKRSDYASIGSIMVHNGIDIMFGGGTGYINEAQKEHLAANGTGYAADDLDAFRSYRGDRLWALFGSSAQPYHIDRDTAAVPSIAEMTSKALDMLSRNRKGFFLMVEGSKVDWAAHGNDIVGMITEFLAFDAAVKEVTEFAKRDGNTLVLILSDHGNSGISIGGPKTNSGYDTQSLESLVGPLRGVRHTTEGLARRINSERIAPGELGAFIEQYTGIGDLTADETKALISASNYFANNLPEVIRKNQPSMERVLAPLISSRSIIGFTTSGHTGEDVFMASYHPEGRTAHGLLDGLDINRYLLAEVGLAGALDRLTGEIYVPHTEVFEGMRYEIVENEAAKTVTLRVENGAKSLSIEGNTNIAVVNGRRTELSSVAVYMGDNKTLYLPRSLRDQLR